MIELNVSTSSRNAMVDITRDVKKYLPGNFSGLVFLYVPHTTAAVTINEGADPAVKEDILKHLQEHIPHSAGYNHVEGNSDAHIKSSLIGNSLSLIAENGNLILGTWQAIFFCEFDGPRNRKVFLKLVKDD